MNEQSNTRENRVQIRLVGSPDDPVISDPAYQKELRGFSSSLHEAGIAFSQRGMAFDSADAMGHPLGEYFVSLAGIVGPVVGVAIGAWIQGRAGRKVKLKVGDIEIEAASQEEVEALLKKALQVKAQIT
jgi:hypothetical protein